MENVLYNFNPEDSFKGKPIYSFGIDETPKPSSEFEDKVQCDECQQWFNDGEINEIAEMKLCDPCTYDQFLFEVDWIMKQRRNRNYLTDDELASCLDRIDDCLTNLRYFLSPKYKRNL